MSEQGEGSAGFVKTFDVIKEQNKVTIVMELVQGGNLYQWLMKKKLMGQCQETDIAAVFRMIC
jgi:serine/threonine protein kinase